MQYQLSLNCSLNISYDLTNNFHGHFSVLFQCPWGIIHILTKVFQVSSLSRAYYNSCKKLMKKEIFALIYPVNPPSSMNKHSKNTEKINADFNLKMYGLRGMLCECIGNRRSRNLLHKEYFYFHFSFLFISCCPMLFFYSLLLDLTYKNSKKMDTNLIYCHEKC